jgi:hypothetical protein
MLDDAFDHSINRRIVSALETRNFQFDQIGVSRRKLRRPDLVVGAAGKRVLPGIANICGSSLGAG